MRLYAMDNDNTKKLNFIFYDTETTGINIDFDQIIQFSAILTNHDFVEIDRINVKCRRLPWIVPSPSAMLITGVRPSQIDNALVQQFPEMMAVIYKKIEDWSPAIFIGYNSFYFDEPLLQRALWQSLHPPYMTITNGNGRADLLPLVRAVSRLAPHALSIPNMASGRPSFKLDRLAPMNGFSHQNAHDALEDTQAVIHLSKKIAARVPNLWNSFVHQSRKRFGVDLINSNAPIYFVEPSNSGKPGWWGRSIDPEHRKSSTAFIVRLDSDWERFFSATEALQKNFLSDPSFQARLIKANMLPIVLSEAEALDSFGIIPSKKEASSDKLLSSPRRQSNLMRLLTQIPARKPEPEALEQRIFEGFPSKGDERTMREFWSVPWPKRLSLINEFEDPRFQQIAQRLVFLMVPQSLSNSAKARIRRGIKDRLLAPHSDKSLWRTISLAQAEIAELRNSSTDNEALNEISGWLTDIEKSLTDDCMDSGE